MAGKYTQPFTLVGLTILFLLGTISISAPTSPTQPTQDSVKTQAAKMSVGETGQPNKNVMPDSSANLSNSPKSRADSIKVVKHNFNHREQIITGSVVMLCLAMILVAMNNYNPR